MDVEELTRSAAHRVILAVASWLAGWGRAGPDARGLDDPTDGMSRKA